MLKRSEKSLIKRNVAALLIIVGVGIGALLAIVLPAPTQPQSIEWLGEPRPIASFRLASSAAVFDQQSLQGRWTIVVFGFVNCPDICPTSLSQLGSLATRLAEQNKAADLNHVQYVFVSVDPGRDSVKRLSQYVQHFHTSILGVTGEAAQLQQLASSLGVQFEVSPDDVDYRVAHSITYSIIDSAGRLRGRFRPGFDVDSLARNFSMQMTNARLEFY